MLNILLGAFPIMVSHVLASFYMAEHRFSKKTTLALWIGYGLCILALWCSLGEPDGSGLPFLVIGYYVPLVLQAVLYFFATKGSLGQRAFLLITYAMLFSTICGIMDIFRYHIFENPFGWQMVVLNVLMLALFVWLFLRKLLPLVQSCGRYIERWWALCGVSLLFWAAVTSMTIWPRSIWSSTGVDLLNYILFVLLVCGVYPVLFGHLQAMAKVAQAKQSELQLELLQTQVETQQRQNEEARRIRHDMRHHNRILTAYANADDMQSLLAYLNQQEQQLDSQTETRYCANDTLSNILSVYAGKAAAQGILVDIAANAEQALSVTPLDLVAIVANLMENAIHGAASAQIEGAYLKLRIHPRADKLVIRCENSCAKTLCFEDALPETIKGVGIGSILVAADRYHGQCSFSAKGGNFTVIIILEI